MKKRFGFMILLTMLLLALCMSAQTACAEAADETVQAVIDQLQAIDTLQEMQNKRSEYTVSSSYDASNAAVVAEHEAARSGYETYVSKMFAARIAAQEAYDALSAEQKAQIDASLVARLNDSLDTVFHSGTYPITQRDDEYVYQVVSPKYLSYELSAHVTESRDMPATLILVDTATSGSTWTPSGKYVHGSSNYLVTYCCDLITTPVNGTHYKRINLEDSDYYGESAAAHIRAIVQNSYPFISLSEMKSQLKAGGLSSSFVDTVTRADVIAAVQMAIWAYANTADSDVSKVISYGGTLNVTNNGLIPVLHDYSNESWDWWPKQNYRTITYDAEADYRVNTLVYYLCSLPGVKPSDDEIIISDVKVTRADLVAGTDDVYSLGMYVYLNEGGSENDYVTISVTSTDAAGQTTGSSVLRMDGRSGYAMTVQARIGDTINVVVDGTQYLPRGVYFYEPEGGRDASQALVGVADGSTKVHAEESFVFQTDVGMGLRIYKTEQDTGLPISEIVFDVYSVVPGEGESVSPVPTDEEIARYAVEANKVGSVTTDSTGYAALALNEGLYLVVEQHNTAKVVAPVSPFYVQIPMPTQAASANGESGTEVVVEYLDVVSIYPKNTPVDEPENPPEIPSPPDNVSGYFSIYKHDESDSGKALAGAQFQVFRAATEEDANPQIVTCDGVEYAVVPVTVNGSVLTLTTNENGTATSPSLTCGVYFLVETEAPAGYVLPEEAVSVTVVSSEISADRTVSVANREGTVLPETGGEGTRVLMAIGAVLTLAAAVLLVRRRRAETAA